MEYIPNQIWVIIAMSVVHMAIIAREDRAAGNDTFVIDAVLNFIIAGGAGWLYWQAAIVGKTAPDVQMLAAGIGSMLGLRGIEYLRGLVPKFLARLMK